MQQNVINRDTGENEQLLHEDGEYMIHSKVIEAAETPDQTNSVNWSEVIFTQIEVKEYLFGLMPFNFSSLAIILRQSDNDMDSSILGFLIALGIFLQSMIGLLVGLNVSQNWSEPSRRLIQNLFVIFRTATYLPTGILFCKSADFNGSTLAIFLFVSVMIALDYASTQAIVGISALLKRKIHETTRGKRAIQANATLLMLFIVQIVVWLVSTIVVSIMHGIKWVDWMYVWPFVLALFMKLVRLVFYCGNVPISFAIVPWYVAGLLYLLFAVNICLLD